MKERGKERKAGRGEGGRKEENQDRERGKRFGEAKYPFFYIKSLPGSLYSTSSGRVAHKSLCQCFHLPFVF